MMMMSVYSNWGNWCWERNCSTRRANWFSATLSTTNLKWTGVGLNRSLGCERSATDLSTSPKRLSLSWMYGNIPPPPLVPSGSPRPARNIRSDIEAFAANFVVDWNVHGDKWQSPHWNVHGDKWQSPHWNVHSDKWQSPHRREKNRAGVCETAAIYSLSLLARFRRVWCKFHIPIPRVGTSWR